MRHLIHLVDNTKFKFVSDLDEIGHYEIINSRSTILKDGLGESHISPGGDKKWQEQLYELTKE